jgi:hypothetical protein
MTSTFLSGNGREKVIQRDLDCVLRRREDSPETVDVCMDYNSIGKCAGIIRYNTTW